MGLCKGLYSQSGLSFEIRDQGLVRVIGFCEQVYIKGLKGDQIAVPFQQGKLYQIILNNLNIILQIHC